MTWHCCIKRLRDHLLALMLLSESRRAARVATDGTMVRLTGQDRTRWDRTLISEGHELVRACLRRSQPGPLQIQAAVAAVHAAAPATESTDWSQIVALYDQLCALRPSPVAALNRSVAIAELHGPAEGLDALAEIGPASLEKYQPYHAARADLLARAGRHDEAIAAYDRAIELTTKTIERDFLPAARRPQNGRPLRNTGTPVNGTPHIMWARDWKVGGSVDGRIRGAGLTPDMSASSFRQG